MYNPAGGNIGGIFYSSARVRADVRDTGLARGEEAIPSRRFVQFEWRICYG